MTESVPAEPRESLLAMGGAALHPPADVRHLPLFTALDRTAQALGRSSKVH